MPINNKKIIEVKNVSFRYMNANVLDNISFSVNAGEYLGIIGPNGGGKTTLLKIILGILKPEKGNIKIFGENLNNKSLLEIGYVPQRASKEEFHFPATVKEIVLSGITARKGTLGRLSEIDRENIKMAMEVTGVMKYENRLIHKLSGGERQKVWIARALAGSPKILILDEPSTGVDISSQEDFYAFLRKMNDEFGMTIIFISHDIDVIANQANTVLCLNNELVCHGSPKEFLKAEYMERLYGKKIKFVSHHN